nr:glycoside hydrolase family 9 protein [Candidatus Sigynarchaeota archaeon]
MRKDSAGLITLVAIGLFVTSSVIAGIRVMPVPETPKVLVNQVGYWPDMEKVFIFQANDQSVVAGAVFDVVNVNGTVILQDQPMTYDGLLWHNHYASGNFTSIVAPGTYEVVVRGGGAAWRSPRFAINDGVYDILFERAVEFYYYQRCGYAPTEIVPGYVGHLICHADDGYWVDEAGAVHWKNMSGGWHDAGDYGKYMESEYNTQYTVYALAYAYETCKEIFNGLESKYDTAAPDIVDETVWGAQYLQKVIVPDSLGDARVLCNIFRREKGRFDRMGYWGVPWADTDNVANTSDDRMAASLFISDGDTWAEHHEYSICFVNSAEAMMVAAALAKAAWIEKDFPYWNDEPYNATNLVANATALHDSHVGLIINATYAVNRSQDWSTLWTTLDCITELARWANYTHDDAAWNRYIMESNTLRTRLINRMDTNSSSVWTNIHDTVMALFHHDAVVNGSVGTDLVDLIGRYTNETIIPAANSTDNVFKFYKSNTWIEDPPGTWYFYEYYFHYWGHNWATSTAAAVAMLGYNMSGNQELKLRAADNVVHWMLGRNPLDLCQVESLGTHNLPIYHHRYASIPGNPRGASPGCIPNGIARAPPIETGNWWQVEDLPWYDMRSPIPGFVELGDFRSNEPYITDNAGFLIGLATFIKYWD